MGGGTYCSTTRLLRSKAMEYETKTSGEIFTARNINSAMNPFGINVRESRDSAEHPNSLAIILGLDETGSMGTVPHFLVKEGLPLMMDSIIKSGIADPQVLFLGIGDHECDQAPLQVGQFESSDELLDKWLTDLYLEGRGGGNAGESYMLAWYFAAHHTAVDCFEKRLQKGVLITIGDEPVLPHVPANFLKNLMGPGEYENCSSQKLLDEAREKYDVYHIHVRETSSGSRQSVMDDWRQLLVDHLLIAERRTDVARLVVEAVCESAEIDNVQHVTAPDRPAETMML